MPNPVLLSRRIRKAGESWNDARSWFGGNPRLAGMRWPRHPQKGHALIHLAQIDLVEASRHAGPGLLPASGWLSFFHGGFEAEGGAVVYVPGHELPEVSESPSKVTSLKLFATSLPYWPMDIGSMDRAPKLLSHGKPYRVSFERKAREVLAAEDRRVWWHSAQQLSRILARSARPQTAQWERNRLEAARTRNAGAEEIRKLEEDLAKVKAANAETNRLLPAMLAFAAEIARWAGAHSPWSLMSAQDRSELKMAHSRCRSEFKPFTALVPSDQTDFEIETLYTMVTAGPEIFDQLPLEFANWLPKASHPTNGVHKMFGAPMETQAAYLNQARLKDKHLLFELVTDDMLAIDFGEVGAFQFYISPEDLANRKWSSVLGVAGMI